MYEYAGSHLEWLQRAASYWLPLLADASVKGCAILLLAAGTVLVMRKTSAAARQMVWVLAMASLLALPILSATLPAWQVLPDWFRLELHPGAPAAVAEQVAVEQEPLPQAGGPLATEPRVQREAAGQVAAFPGGPPTTSDHAELPSVEPAAPAVAPTAAKNPSGRGSWVAMLLPWVLPAWAAGALACLAPLVLGRLSLWRVERSAQRIASGTWMSLLRRAASQLKLTSPVVLLESRRRAMPMVWGLRRVKLLLPAEATAWSAEKRYVVLLHELAHAKRHDCLAKLVAHLAAALYWFNPLAWLAMKRLTVEAETACDDLVLSAGSKASDYAEHLLEIASGLKAGMLAAYSSIAMARPSKLEGRLLAILDDKRSRRRLTGAAILLGAMLITGLVLPLSVLKGAASGTKRAKEAAQAVELPAQAEVNVVRECVLGPENIAGGPKVLDIDSGRFMPASDSKAYLAWSGMRLAQGFPIGLPLTDVEGLQFQPVPTHIQGKPLQKLWEATDPAKLPPFPEGHPWSYRVGLPPTRQPPYVLAFRTRTGTVGVIEWLPDSIREMADSIHLRYKVLAYGQPLEPKRPSSQPATQPGEGLTFGPVIERTLPNVFYYASPHAIDFETGQLIFPPPDLIVSDEQALEAWCAESGADAWYTSFFNESLRGQDCYFAGIAPQNWETITPTEALEELRTQVLSPELTRLFVKDAGPQTCVFNTREGGIGILQVLARTEKPDGVNIRYKMVRGLKTRLPRPQPSTQPATQPAEAKLPREVKAVITKEEHERKAVLDEAWRLFQAGQYADSARAYQGVLDKYSHWYDSRDPRAGDVLMMIGLCYANMEQYDKAIEFYRRQIKEFPTSPDYLVATCFYLGDAYLRNKREPEALEAFQKCLDLGRGTRNPEAFPLKHARQAVEKLQREPGSQPSPATQPRQWQARLSYASTVQVVGISDLHSEPRQWWKPDGTPLAEPPYPGMKDADKQYQYELVIRFDGPADAGDTWRVTGATHSGNMGRPTDANGRAIENLRVLAVGFPDAREAVDFRYGVAAGRWATIAESDGKNPMSIDGKEMGIAFSKAHAIDGAAAITVTHNVKDREVRIVGVDTAGKVHTPERTTGTGAGDFIQVTASFPRLSPDQIAEFRVQARPYEWVEFRNVSLRPGHKTDVQVVPGAGSLPALLHSPATQGEIYITGRVQRPGVYSLSARGINVRQLLAAAGYQADEKKELVATVIRRGADGTETRQRFDIDGLYNGTVGDIDLMPNDLILVEPDEGPTESAKLLQEKAQLTRVLDDLRRLKYSDEHQKVLVEKSLAAYQPATQPGSQGKTVRLVIGPDYVEFQGRRAGAEELPALLADVLDRSNTTLEIAAASGAMLIDDFQKLEGQAMSLAKSLGYAGTSYVGVHPPSEAGSDAAAAKAPAKGGTGRRYFVRLVVGMDRMTFEGREVTWQELPALIEKLPNRPCTVLELASASGGLTVEHFDAARVQAEQLVSKYGLEYLSLIGTHPPGSKGSAPQDLPGKERTEPPSPPAAQPEVEKGKAGFLETDIAMPERTGR